MESVQTTTRGKGSRIYVTKNSDALHTSTLQEGKLYAKIHCTHYHSLVVHYGLFQCGKRKNRGKQRPPTTYRGRSKSRRRRSVARPEPDCRVKAISGN